MAKICKNCGSELPDNARECSYCGTVFEQAPEFQTTPEAPDPVLPNSEESAKPKLSILAILGILLMLASVVIDLISIGLIPGISTMSEAEGFNKLTIVGTALFIVGLAMTVIGRRK